MKQIDDIVSMLEEMYTLNSFDAKKLKWNVIAYRVTDLYDSGVVSKLDRITFDFVSKIRHTIPTPISLLSFQADFNKFMSFYSQPRVMQGRAMVGHQAHSGRWASDTFNRGNTPSSIPDDSPSYDSGCSDSGSSSCD